MHICVFSFIELLSFYFFYRYVLNESQSRQNSSSAQGSSSSGGGGTGIPQPPPGMSFYAAKRVIGDNPWTPEQLEQVSHTVCLCWSLALYVLPIKSLPRISHKVCLKRAIEVLLFYIPCSYLLKFPQGKGGVRNVFQFFHVAYIFLV